MPFGVPVTHSLVTCLRRGRSHGLSQTLGWLWLWGNKCSSPNSLQMPPKPQSSAFPGTTDQVLRLGRVGQAGPVLCGGWKDGRAVGETRLRPLALSLSLIDFC